MKAFVCTQYGPPARLGLTEVEKPAVGDDKVLVEVHAASVTFSNVMQVTGKPFIGRLMGLGLRKPNTRMLGSDVAGRVEAVGRNVTRFRPGDEVFGDLSRCGKGSYAEYVCAPERDLALKPANLTFEEAAAVPEASLVALQALRDAGHIQKGQKVLICGASGGIGTFAVQLARYFGADVTGVCGARNVDLVRSLGADHVIDYKREDFTKSGLRYDLIVATAGYRSLPDYRRALGPGGIYVATGGAMPQVFEALILGPLFFSTGGKKMMSMLVDPNKDLVFMKELIEAGEVKPVIDRCYPLRETGAALQYYAEGHVRGKVIITVGPAGSN